MKYHLRISLILFVFIVLTPSSIATELQSIEAITPASTYLNIANNLYVSSSNVGIGTTSPSYNLHVNGNFYANTVNTGIGNTEVYLMNQNVRTTDAVTFATVNTGQGANELYAMNQNVRTTDSPTFSNVYIADNMIHSGDTDTYIGFPAADTIRMVTAGTERVRVLSNGNVGIGTTAPDRNFHLWGTADYTGTLPIAEARRATAMITSDYPHLIIGSSVSNVNHAGTLSFWHNNAGGATTRQWNIGASDNGISIGFCINNTNPHCGLNDYSTTSALHIDENKYVGIGTTAPAQKLHVAGNVRVDGAIVAPEGTLRDDGGGWVRTYGNTGWYSQTYGGGWYMTDTTWIRSYGNKNIYQNTGILRTDGTLQVGSSGGTLNVVNGGNFAYRANVLFANTAGNVGIGTTSPAQKLHVAGNTYVTGYLGVGSSNPVKALDVRGDAYISGNVGIGTTNPGAKLDVNGNTKLTQNTHIGKWHHVLDYSNTGTPTNGYKIKTNLPFQNGMQMPLVKIQGYMYGSAAPIDINIVWYIYGGAFTRYSASSSGSYAPSITLANESNKVVIFLSGGVYYSRFNIQVYENMGTSDSYFEGWTVVDEAVTGSPSVSVPYSANFGNSFVMNTNGNVGIGTTAPADTLDVNGDVRVRGGDIKDSGGTARITFSGTNVIIRVG